MEKFFFCSLFSEPARKSLRLIAVYNYLENPFFGKVWERCFYLSNKEIVFSLVFHRSLVLCVCFDVNHDTEMRWMEQHGSDGELRIYCSKFTLDWTLSFATDDGKFMHIPSTNRISLPWGSVFNWTHWDSAEPRAGKSI